MILTSASNFVALLGWVLVVLLTALSWNEPGPPSEGLMKLTLFCECISASEAGRIALGVLRGDLALAITVHYTRLLMWFVTLADPSVTSTTVKLVLTAWSVTEVGRYPMVLFPQSAALKTLRYAVPVVTFPLGAGMEAWASYNVLMVTTNNLLRVALACVIVVNVGGGAVWYPSMVAKVGKSLRPADKKGK